MKTFKKSIAALLAILMILTASPLTAFAAMTDKSGECGDGIYKYTAATDTLYINCSQIYFDNYGKLYDIDVSSFSHLIVGKDVTSIEYRMGSKKMNLLSKKSDYYYYDMSYDLTCEEGCALESIGDSAFMWATVTDADFTNASKLTTISDRAFQLSDLENIKLPASISLIGHQSFANTDKLNSAEIDENAQSVELGTLAFYLSSITEFTAPAGLETISERAFDSCRRLEKFTFLTKETEEGVKGVKTINAKAFYDTAIKELVFPETCESICNSSAYSGMTKLEKVDFSKLRCELPSMSGKSALKEVIFPAEVQFKVPDLSGTAIESFVYPENATGFTSFAQCTKLKSVVLPDDITEIPANAFRGCVSLESVNLPDTLTIVKEYAFSGCERLVITKLPSDLRQIEEGAFRGCKKLTAAINIDCNKNFKLGNSGFEGTGIKSINISATGTYLIEFGDAAFKDCDNLTDINLSNMLKGISASCFEGCDNLEKIIIPYSILSTGVNAFKDCTKLKYIGYDYAIPHLNTISSGAFSGCLALEEFDVPCGVTKINPSAFSGCVNLKKITMPERVSTIGAEAFKDCVGLSSIALPQKLATIGAGAFQGCTGIESMTLPNKVKTIDEGAFADCVGLSSIVLPQSLTTIGAKAFKNCTALKSINLDDTAVTFIDKETFTNCAFDEIKLSKVTSVTYRGFYDCPSLKKVVLGSNISLGYEAFIGCPIEEVTVTDPLFNKNYSNIFDNIKVINAYSNTQIEKYANDNNITFNSLGVYDPTVEETSIPASGGRDGHSQWYITDDKTLVINCTNVDENKSVYITSTTYGSDGNEYNYVDIINAHNVRKVVIGEGFSEISSFTNKLKVKSTLETIELPEGLTYIGRNAFYNANIDHIKLPDSLTEIDDYAFESANLQGGVEFGSGIESIGEMTFAYCNFDEINLPNGVFAGSKSFKACYGLKSVYIPEQSRFVRNAFGLDQYNNVIDDFYVIVEVNSSAHKLCIDNGLNYRLNLEGEYITGYVETSNLSKWAYFPDTRTLYYYANSLMILDYDGDGAVTYYYDDTGSRYDKNHKKHKVLPGELEVDKVIVTQGSKNLGWGALFEALNPKEIILPEGLTNIEDETFNGLSRLEYINIPDSVTKIESGAFDNCTALRMISFGKGMTEIPSKLLFNNSNVRFVEFRGDVTSIGDSAFRNCTALEEIEIPSTVTKIGANAFNKCLKLKSITIGGAVKEIGEGAFANLTFCDTVIIGSGGIELGDSAETVFKNLGSSTQGVAVSYTGSCTKADLAMFSGQKVVEINFGANVNEVVGKSALPDLRIIKVDEANNVLKTYGNCLYASNNDGIVLKLVPTSLKEVELMDGTVTIDQGAFYGGSLEYITLPESVAVIGSEAFKDCRALKKIILSSSLERIRPSAFEGCTKLKIVEIPSAKYIHNSAFKNCLNLSSILLPHNIETIEADTFNGCSSLKSIVIPKSVAHLGERAFANCSILDEIYMFNTSFEKNTFENSNNVTVCTMAGSDSFVNARSYGVSRLTYTDENVFNDQCAMKEDIYEGYLGFCSNGHGDIDYITVYEPTCEQDGYIIGVCEYCSVILEEKHIEAAGHCFKSTVSIPATDTTQGVEKSTCVNCGESFTAFTPALSNNAPKTLCTVTGRAVLANDKTGENGSTPLKNASVRINGEVVAESDSEGKFTFDIETGVYEAVIHANYGFDRTVYLVVEDKAVNMGDIPVVACDWNKDGIIDNSDLNLFRLILSSKVGDASYLDFADMNNDGRIDVKDLIFMNNVIGLDSSFAYPPVIINSNTK